MDFLILFGMYIIIPSLLITIGFLIRRGFSLMKEVEASQQRYNQMLVDTYYVLDGMLEQMRDLDIKGAFESDDEVGTVFTELKTLIEQYKNELDINA